MMKNAERFHCILRRKQHLKLLAMTASSPRKLTLAWMIRAMVMEFCESHLKPDLPVERGNLGEIPQRFNLIFYGDLFHLKTIVARNGYQLGPLVRFVVDEFLTGRFCPRIFSVRNIKQIRKVWPKAHHRTNRANQPVGEIVYPTPAHFYQKADYRPRDHGNLAALLWRGLMNRKYHWNIYFPLLVYFWRVE